MRWPWQRRAPDTTVSDQIAAWEREMRSAGWRHWLYEPPVTYPLVEVHRREWAQPKLCNIDQINPMMNIGDLWWRPFYGPLLKGDVIVEGKALS